MQSGFENGSKGKYQWKVTFYYTDKSKVPNVSYYKGQWRLVDGDNKWRECTGSTGKTSIANAKYACMEAIQLYDAKPESLPKDEETGHDIVMAGEETIGSDVWEYRVLKITGAPFYYGKIRGSMPDGNTTGWYECGQEGADNTRGSADEAENLCLQSLNEIRAMA